MLEVDIDLVKPQGSYCQLIATLANRTKNSGRKEVEVPQGLNPGTYKVKVESKQCSAIYGESATISIDAEDTSLAKGAEESALQKVANEMHDSRKAPDIQHLQAELESLREERLCKVCFESEADCVILECGHKNVCQTCARHSTCCPMCRGLITRVVPTFG